MYVLHMDPVHMPSLQLFQNQNLVLQILALGSPGVLNRFPPWPPQRLGASGISEEEGMKNDPMSPTNPTPGSWMRAGQFGETEPWPGAGGRPQPVPTCRLGAGWGERGSETGREMERQRMKARERN